MKRAYLIHLLICFVLAAATGDFLKDAINNSNIIHGIYAVLAGVALVLNIICGPDPDIFQKLIEKRKK